MILLVWLSCIPSTITLDDTEKTTDVRPDTGDSAETAITDTASDSPGDTEDTADTSETTDTTDTVDTGTADTADSGTVPVDTGDTADTAVDTGTACVPGLSVVAAVVIDPYTTAWPNLTGCAATGLTVSYPAWLQPITVPTDLDGSVQVMIASTPGQQNLSGTVVFSSDQGSVTMDVTLGHF